ncbi:MAG: hypothetical protein IAE93_07940 [Ignavibacteria bacterium]|nr:hypothetical protein [Ignavibacteria bacterium]
MMKQNTEAKLYQIFRIAIAMCFIGHGAFGIITKQVWCNYFAVFGIGQETAYKLMPLVGTFDIIMGILIIIYPMRIVPLWLVIWGIFTALLRPLSNEPFAEFLERAGNYGVPFAMLLLIGFGNNFKDSISRMKSSFTVEQNVFKKIEVCLRVTVFLLLLGHGWLNLIHKQGLLNQYSSLGISDPLAVANIVGIFEILAALLVLIKPLRSILIPLLIWKIVSEMLYPAYAYWEWIERGGSYAAILALWIVTNPALYKKQIINNDN